MSAGLPATGAGGALYLLFIVWMLLRELARAANGNGFEPSRWAFIGKMAALSLVMVLVIIGERFLVHGALEFAVTYIPGLAKFAIVPSTSFVLFMAAMPFAILLLIVGCLHGLRFALALNQTTLIAQRGQL